MSGSGTNLLLSGKMISVRNTEIEIPPGLPQFYTGSSRAKKMILQYSSNKIQLAAQNPSKTDLPHNFLTGIITTLSNNPEELCRDQKRTNLTADNGLLKKETMKANILVNGTACIKTIVKKLSQISDLSDIEVNNNSVVSFIYHSEDAALRVFEELGRGDLLRKNPLSF